MQPQEIPDPNQLALQIRQELVDFCNWFGEDFIVIGGWAVHAYHPHHLTLDGDAMISQAAAGTIRDFYQVTPNPRMRKAQILSQTGCDIDLYIEHQHALRIPFHRVQALSRIKNNLRVACPEHLLVLKTDAAIQRQHSAKGQKDAEDLISLLSLPIEEFQNPQELAFLTKNNIKFLKKLAFNKKIIDKNLVKNGILAIIVKQSYSPKFVFTNTQKSKQSEYNNFSHISKIVKNRWHTPQGQPITIDQLAQKAGLTFPILTSSPIQIFFDDSLDSPLVRNLPSNSYSTNLKDPLLILEALAYVAHEWQARETLLLKNKPLHLQRFPAFVHHHS